jgi:hypothetical protein
MKSSLWRIIRYIEHLFAPADQIEERFYAMQSQVAKLSLRCDWPRCEGKWRSSRPPFRRRLAMAGQASPARGLPRRPLVRAAPFRSTKFVSHVPNALGSPANSSPKTRTMNWQRNFCNESGIQSKQINNHLKPSKTA